MANPKVTAVCASNSVRECIEIALRGRADVTFVPATETALASPVDLVICEIPAAAAAARSASTNGTPVIAVGEGRLPGCVATLPNPFHPEALRYAVRDSLHTVLRPTEVGTTPDFAVPMIPAAADAIARTSARTGLPTLICGETGTGTRRLARHIHALAGAGRFLVVPASRFDADAVASLWTSSDEPRLTVCVDRVDLLPAEGSERLATLLDHGLFAAGTSRHLIGTAELDPDALLATSTIDAGAYFGLAVLPIHLPPLRERSDAIPEIAASILTRLGRTFDPARTWHLAEDACERMRRYPWPGNLAELEAVLARSAAFARSEQITAKDLLFEIVVVADDAPIPAATMPTPDETEAVHLHEGASPPARSGEVDLLLQELAHELKNPMVTIKTVAQHLERLLEKESDQREMARITGEAIDRMDRALENLLEFPRFGVPTASNLRLGDLVGECLESMDAELLEHRILLDDRIDPSATVAADRGQIGYAIANLVRAVVRAAGEGATLVVRSPLTRNGLLLEFPTTTASVTAALARWSDTAPAASGIEASIPFVFARALVERNGGSVTVRAGDGKTAIRVELPQGTEEAEEDEEAAYLDR